MPFSAFLLSYELSLFCQNELKAHFNFSVSSCHLLSALPNKLVLQGKGPGGPSKLVLCSGVSRGRSWGRTSKPALCSGAKKPCKSQTFFRAPPPPPLFLGQYPPLICSNLRLIHFGPNFKANTIRTLTMIKSNTETGTEMTNVHKCIQSDKYALIAFDKERVHSAVEIKFFGLCIHRHRSGPPENRGE